MHGEGEVGLALGCQHARRRETRVVDEGYVVIAFPLDGVWRIGDYAVERLIVPVLGFKERVAAGDVELLVVDVVQEHVDRHRL